ncbi:MAG: MBL fold metallo-hydrolase [Deltaproteobacteria bacterium]|nr:MBL fold metallo-hydrolase [Deltaproteobacteria bacterium]
MLLRRLTNPHLGRSAYLVGCPKAGEAVLVDPERDMDRYLAAAAESAVRITAVAETHLHCEFLSGALEVAQWLDTPIYLSGEGRKIESYSWSNDPSYDIRPLLDGDTFRVGDIELQAISTPSHTPEHLCYLVTDRGADADQPRGLLTGDFLQVGGLGEPDPCVDWETLEDGPRSPLNALLQSLRALLLLPDFVQIWPGRCRVTNSEDLEGGLAVSTIGYERRFNEDLRRASDNPEAYNRTVQAEMSKAAPYYARMKRDNRLGPAVLGRLPKPRLLTPRELQDLAGRVDTAVIDTRTDRRRFMEGHLAGSLYAPLDQHFSTVAGSYVEEGQPIYLILPEDRLEQAVRALVRIGLDSVIAYAPPEMLERLQNLRRTRVLDFRRALQGSKRPEVQVLDVRAPGEFEDRHLPGAHNIAHTDLVNRRQELDRNKELVVHCESGSRAATASAFLERFGHRISFVDDLFDTLPLELSTTRSESLV